MNPADYTVTRRQAVHTFAATAIGAWLTRPLHAQTPPRTPVFDAPLASRSIALRQTTGSDSEKYLVFDTRVLDTLENAYLVLGKVEKDARNPLIREDKPWEVNCDNLYPNVLFDTEEQLFKCWYSPFIVDSVNAGATAEIRSRMTRWQAEKAFPGRKVREMGVCYATSKDGIVWDKSELGAVKYDGSTKNNVVLRAAHGAGVIKDLRDSDPRRRYKMFLLRSKMCVAFSSDGVHWPESVDCPEIEADGDTHNNALWVPELKKWVGITRLRSGGVRTVGRTESDDFVRWTKATEVLRGTWRQCQVYAMPVFRYGNLYLGLPMIFDKGRDVVHCELAWSPDTREWHRLCPDTPLLARGPEGGYDWGCVFAAAHPIVVNNEIRLYYGGSDAQHFDFRKGSLCLATMKKDHWAGYQHSGKRTGIVGFKPVPCRGSKLAVTANAKGGSIKVFISEAGGKEVVPPVELVDNVVEHVIADVSRHRDRQVTVRFELKDATVYSFSFHD
jgi:hypothetical protein